MRPEGDRSECLSHATVLINAESLAPPLTGIGNYTFQLLQHLLVEAIPDRLVAFHGGRVLPAAQAVARCRSWTPDSVRGAERRMSWLHWLADKTTLPYAVHQWRVHRAFLKAAGKLPDPVVYHEPNYILKPFDGATVMSVHDLSVFRYPQYHPASRVRFLSAKMADSLERADRIVTDSPIISRELSETFGISPERVRAIPLGISDSIRPMAESDCRTTLDRLGLTYGRFVLCVSTFEPRKNLASLLDAYEGLENCIQKRFPLVLVGARGWLTGSLDERVRRLGERGIVRRLGYVADDDLKILYAAARVFCLPSVYEGFGLPALEAMGAGTAAIVGEGTTMADFGGDAVETVDVLDPAALGESIRKLIEDETQNAELVEKGLERSSRLTWRRCARAHLEVYVEALSGASSRR